MDVNAIVLIPTTFAGALEGIVDNYTVVDIPDCCNYGN